uniref:EF-hand domain-containing protein n=1 Tax=Panagrolaimus superbus TaxID=310955 RepID=A0A914XWT2_9BILA
MIKITIFLSLTLLLVSALEGKYDGSNDFDQIDLNSDGSVSLSEFLKWRHSDDQQKSIRLFKSYDINVDGNLSVPEFVPLVYALSRSPTSEAEKFFQQLDYNHDGVLTRDEAEKSKEHIPEEITNGLFQVADTNFDGQITLQEFLAVMESADNSQQTSDSGTAQALLVAMDLDGNQKLDKNEVLKYANRYNRVSKNEIDNVFNLLDGNHDTFLSANELEKLPGKLTELAGIRPMPAILN